MKRDVGESKREFYARQYGDGKMTLAKAAREAGVSLWEADYVRQRKITAQYDMEDLRHDLKVVYGRQERG